MTSIAKVIKDSGMNPIQCPHCGRSVATNTLWSGFFRKIIEVLRTGETVTITGFGNFRARMLKGRTLKSPLLKKKGGKVTFGDRLVMRFHASASAKKVLNGEVVDTAEVIEDEDEAEEKPKTAKKGGGGAEKGKGGKPDKKSAKVEEKTKGKSKKSKPAPEPEEDEDEDDEELEEELEDTSDDDEDNDDDDGENDDADADEE